MPITLKNGGKRKSRNPKRRMLKRSMKRKIAKRYSRRKIKGGMNYIPDEKKGDLIYIWNSLLNDRLKNYEEYNKKQLLLTNTDVSSLYALFVIDMQNDFLDNPYNRAYSLDGKNMIEDENEKNLVENYTKTGNFAVAQGSKMLKNDDVIPTKLNNLLSKINDAYKDPLCKYIIFSRDYHPVDHMSFSPAYSTFYQNNYLLNEYMNEYMKKNKDNPYTGNFPAHCIECHNGSSFIPELIEGFFNNIISDNDQNKSKVKIVFKGIHSDIDSFSGVGKYSIDSYASNSTTTPPVCVGCSKKTGGFIFKKEKSIEENVNFLSKINIEEMIAAPYDDWLEDVKKIEVCGLAGDYCVRDTIVALSEKFKDKTIILLQDLTRYAFLPVFTINTLPQHRSQKTYSKAKDDNTLKIYPESYQNLLLNTTNTNKGINYYIFKDRKLMDKTYIDNNKDEIKTKMFDLKGDNLYTALTYEHFITNHKDILDDYIINNNVKILMDETNLAVRSK